MVFNTPPQSDSIHIYSDHNIKSNNRLIICESSYNHKKRGKSYSKYLGYLIITYQSREQMMYENNQFNIKLSLSLIRYSYID